LLLLGTVFQKSSITHILRDQSSTGWSFTWVNPWWPDIL